MLDLGIVRGTKVKALHKSPCGDPVAYMIRGAVLAVRGSDAEKNIYRIQVIFIGLDKFFYGLFRCGRKKRKMRDYIVALAGNPNVGKSTVFNALTGLKQHTGNWPGKTVGNAVGKYLYKGKEYSLVDVPGTYSLLANSAEEEIARDFLLLRRLRLPNNHG